MTNEIWTIGRILKWTEQYFRQKGIASARLDGEVLLSHVLDKNRIYCYTHYDEPLTKDELARYKECVLKRANGFTVAVITGFKEFMGLKFSVDSNVLIPRPDTEILVEKVLDLFKGRSHYNILDMCTGPGTILLSILAYDDNAMGIGVDISLEALNIAQKNVNNLKLENRVQLYKSNLFESLNVLENKFDIITSNPPYIPTNDIKTLSIEVKNEPIKALDGGEDGLYFYPLIINNGYRYLKVNGYMALELGINQAEAVAKLAAKHGGYEIVEFWHDLAGIKRHILLKKR